MHTVGRPPALIGLGTAITRTNLIARPVLVFVGIRPAKRLTVISLFTPVATLVDILLTHSGGTTVETTATNVGTGRKTTIRQVGRAKRAAISAVTVCLARPFGLSRI